MERCVRGVGIIFNEKAVSKSMENNWFPAESKATSLFIQWEKFSH